MFCIESITRFHDAAVRAWHDCPIVAEPVFAKLDSLKHELSGIGKDGAGNKQAPDGPFVGDSLWPAVPGRAGGAPGPTVRSAIWANHAFNFLLWHEEDLARDPDATDAVIAGVKRRIDRLNQARNDAMELIDDAIGMALSTAGVVATADATRNTETAGAAIDRLSILALRIYHYNERAGEVSDTDLRQRIVASLVRCRDQQAHLREALQQLVGELFSGKKRHGLFRQFKMYNDPSLNPVLVAKR